ncbi:hypothetical protein DUI87_33191 [Hirundo rustica rustica]|uniref:VWFD domain-containing protein n=1 Tax=Hirundo rustica rustica TaxID=333673 RepID=A0A3M0IRH7_HIRRU|nr:hypothetical protein DUI87_33191 [Hirundo rustica rustica]
MGAGADLGGSGIVLGPGWIPDGSRWIPAGSRMDPGWIPAGSRGRCRRWCERTVLVAEQEEVTPRREAAVPCPSLYQYSLAGWRLDREQHAPGPAGNPPGDIGTRPALCYIYRAWQCRDGHNGSAVSRAECCRRPRGHSWRRGDAGDAAGPCLPCTRLPLGGDGGSPRHRRAPATFQAWAGTRFRTFDGRHFGFAGACRYSLAAATDGAWDFTVGLGQPRVLHMTFGTDTVVAEGQNVSVNGAAVPKGRPYLHKGLGVTWPGDWVAVASSLGVRVAWDGHLAVTVTAEPELRGGTWGLCGTYTDDPADDFVRPDGDVAAFAAAFGNAWKVPAAATEVDPSGFYAACVALLCGDGDAASPPGPLPSPGPPPPPPGPPPPAACATFAAYARECSRRQLPVPWRRPGLCERRCDAGQRFSDCVSLCPVTCATAGGAERGPCHRHCHGGCECDPGLARDGDSCVSPAACPCHHRRQRYEPGQSIRQRCKPLDFVAGQLLITAEHEPCDGQRPLGCPRSITVTTNRTTARLHGTGDTPGQDRDRPRTLLALWQPSFACPQCPCGSGSHPCTHPHVPTVVGDIPVPVPSVPMVVGDSLVPVPGVPLAAGVIPLPVPHVPTVVGDITVSILNVPMVSGDIPVPVPNVPTVAGDSLLPVPGVPVAAGLIPLPVPHVPTVVGDTPVSIPMSPQWWVTPPVSIPMSPQCVCRGQRWRCGRQECAGTCVATGDPHYVTFDGRAFTFAGDCEYLLAREAGGLFAVTAENVPCGATGVTCTKSVLVAMGNTVVHMLRGQPPALGLGAGSLRGSCGTGSSPPCHDLVPPQRFYEWCVFDACGCDSGGDCECLCTALAAYAEECGRQGRPLHWRSQGLCHGRCLEPAACPCFWDGFAFPAGAAVTQGCSDW